MIISGIYKIKNKVNNKVYIGQSINLNTRYAQHLRQLILGCHFNSYFQHSFNKYGKDNFIYEIIEYAEDLSLLNSKEGFWVEYYGGINSDLIYNSRDPLTGACSDYVKRRFKDMSGENNPNYGNKWTDEQKENSSKARKGISLEERIGKEKADLTKEKMRKSQTGRAHPEEVKEKIRQANIGEKNPAFGRGDRQLGENNPMYGKKSGQRKCIIQFDKEGNVVKEYEFLSQVKEEGFHIGNVAAAARGKLKSSGGFIWKYKD